MIKVGHTALSNTNDAISKEYVTKKHTLMFKKTLHDCGYSRIEKDRHVVVNNIGI